MLVKELIEECVRRRLDGYGSERDVIVMTDTLDEVLGDTISQEPQKVWSLMMQRRVGAVRFIMRERLECYRNASKVPDDAPLPLD